MDPDALLSQLKEMTDNILSDPYGEHDALQFAALFESLDKWLLGGGFIPHDWALAQKWNRRNDG